MNYIQRTVELIKADDFRMQVLEHVYELGLPDCLVAAGFVRDLIWGSLYKKAAPINDVDVIYFCANNCSPLRDRELEEYLYSQAPNIPWSVKNQARMHEKNRDQPYSNSADAMSYWPEKQTAVGVTLNDKKQVCLSHAFDLSLNFHGKITHNPKRSLAVFNQRVSHKKWLETWPLLELDV